jgi:hypothetical protein
MWKLPLHDERLILASKSNILACLLPPPPPPPHRHSHTEQIEKRGQAIDLNCTLKYVGL